MRILLDECIHSGLKAAFPDDAVATVVEIGWRTASDGALVTLATGRFDVLVTLDKNIEHQQNVKRLSFGIVIAHVPENKLVHFEPLYPALLEAVHSVQPGQVCHVYSARSRRRP